MAERGTEQAAVTKISRHDFPSGFVFGGATSAYQVEGAHDADGKGPSNWDAYTKRRPDKITDGSSGSVAIDQYHHYKEDVMLMKSLGLEAYRFSIAWSRLFPDGMMAGVNQKGVRYYNNLIDFCISQGIEPYVTIFHFDLPQYLEDEYGGFLSRNIVDDFAVLAELCFNEFGDRVKHWITINEPWTFAHNSYVSGAFPPGHAKADPIQIVKRITQPVTQFCSSNFSGAINESSLIETINVPLPVMPQYRGSRVSQNTWSTYSNTTIYGSVPYMLTSNTLVKDEEKAPLGDAGTEPYIVAHHLLLAHAKAVQIYKTDYKDKQKGEIGITNMTTWFEPLEDTPEDIKAASRALEFMWGWFTRPIVHGDYPEVMKEYVGSRLPKFSSEEKKLIKGSYDFIGLNYYTTCYVADVPQTSVVKPTYYTDQQLGMTPERRGVRIGPCPGSSWLYIVPSGIQKLLLHTKEIYNDPLIYITENGMSEPNNPRLTVEQALQDHVRIRFYEDHLAFVKDAIGKGVRVKAFFLWSMFDNYEWGDGYTVRFGIYFVDFLNKLARHPKYSALWWKSFMEKNKTNVARLNK